MNFDPAFRHQADAAGQRQHDLNPGVASSESSPTGGSLDHRSSAIQPSAVERDQSGSGRAEGQSPPEDHVLHALGISSASNGGDLGHFPHATHAYLAEIQPSGESRAESHAANETHTSNALSTQSDLAVGDAGQASHETQRKPACVRKSRRKAGGDGDILPAHTMHHAHLTEPSADEAGAIAKSVTQPGAQSLSPTSSEHRLGGDLGHRICVDQVGRAEVANNIAEIRMLWRRHRQWHRAEKSLTLQAFAVCWSFLGGGTENKKLAGAILKRIEEGTATPDDLVAEIGATPLLNARGVIRAEREAVEKMLCKLARKLPVYPWVKSVYGASEFALAKIVGECGDVGSYKSVAAVWKRMGLAVIDGGRQRRASGDAALEHGYSPDRRSVMWNIGGGLIGGMGKGPRPGVGEDISTRDDLSPYQKLFIERLRYEAECDPEAHRKEPVLNTKTGELRESFSAHAANRAKRYVEKRFLRDLYSAWRQTSGNVHSTKRPSDAPALFGEQN